MNQAPRVFISYSHDSDYHKMWVLKFSKRLRTCGINVILDEWDLKLGGDIAVFMEANITDSDKVLIICTDRYNEKADAGTGGVGYEKTIVTRELISNSQSDRFIPIVRQYSGRDKMPKFMGSRRYVDLSDELKFEDEFEELVRQLRGQPHPDKHPVGQYSDTNFNEGVIGTLMRIPRTGQTHLQFEGIIKGAPYTDLTGWKYTIYQTADHVKSCKYVLHVDRHLSLVLHGSPPDEVLTFQDTDSIQSYVSNNVEPNGAIILLTYIGVVKDETLI